MSLKFLERAKLSEKIHRKWKNFEKNSENLKISETKKSKILEKIHILKDEVYHKKSTIPGAKNQISEFLKTEKCQKFEKVLKEHLSLENQRRKIETDFRSFSHKMNHLTLAGNLYQITLEYLLNQEIIKNEIAESKRFEVTIHTYTLSEITHF